MVNRDYDDDGDSKVDEERNQVFLGFFKNANCYQHHHQPKVSRFDDTINSISSVVVGSRSRDSL